MAAENALYWCDKMARMAVLLKMIYGGGKIQFS
jgi:hypothetical protein